MDLVLALSYSGREEILGAAKRFASDVAAGRKAPEELTEELFDGYLDTAGTPPSRPSCSDERRAPHQQLSSLAARLYRAIL